MGPMGSPETSVRNYHRLLRNNPEERSSQELHGHDYFILACYFFYASLDMYSVFSSFLCFVTERIGRIGRDSSVSTVTRLWAVCRGIIFRFPVRTRVSGRQDVNLEFGGHQTSCSVGDVGYFIWC
jgi:hypothetical protein